MRQYLYMQLFLLRRVLGLSPRTLWRMVWRRIAFRLDSRTFAGQKTRISSLHILARLDADNFDAALRPLIDRPLFHRPEFPRPEFDRPGDGEAAADSKDRITAAADAVMAGGIEIFGAAHNIGAPPIDWRRDFRAGLDWPAAPAAKIRVNRLHEPCDIKVPWEISRLQWLFPLAQAWRLTGDDAYAGRIRAVIEDWDAQNPIALGPNWASAMEAGLRGVSLVWLACQCLDAPSWADPGFRALLMRLFWLHGRFVSRNVEWSDVNGNHVIACALGLVVLGCALPGPDGRRWTDQGWRIIRDELPAQTGADGVSFEASSAYHRFVLEMILTAVMARRARDLPIEPETAARAAAMGTFITCYLRDDGSAPNWGDGDDGRVLPFGPRPALDHAVIAAAAGPVLARKDAAAPACPVNAEALFWFCGARPAAAANAPGKAPGAPASAGFADAGVYILRAGGDHVFMDAGPVGMAGRGGHGHNDCLNVEIALCGAPLIIDPGTWTYTADAPARNRFRASAAHNGPVVDGYEINRFVHPRLLWMLHDDAKPFTERFEPAPGGGVITAGHTGYERLRPPVRPARTVRLDGARHEVEIIDDIAFAGARSLSIRYMLHPNVTAKDTGERRIRLNAPQGAFALTWDGPGWTAALEPARAAPGYGVLAATSAVVFSRTGPGPARLVMTIAPAGLATGAKAVNLEP